MLSVLGLVIILWLFKIIEEQKSILMKVKKLA